MSEPVDLHKTYPAVPEAVPEARRALAEAAAAAGATGRTLDDVRLAVSEAVTNAVRHAYPDEPGQVQVSASMVDDSLCVLIADGGRGLTMGHPGGLCMGLPLMAKSSDGLTLEDSPSGGLAVRLRFNLRPDAPDVAATL
jgi:anti-sigma regulatory factor (Ser/Thr protein kinase)